MNLKPIPIERDPKKIREKEIEDQRKHIEQIKLVKLEIEQMMNEITKKEDEK